MTDLQDKFAKTLRLWADRKECERSDHILSDFWEVLALTIDGVGRLDSEVESLQVEAIKRDSAPRGSFRSLDFRAVVDQAEESARLADEDAGDEGKRNVLQDVADAGFRTASGLLRIVETLETQAARIGEQQTAIADLQRQVGNVAVRVDALSGQYRSAMEREADRLDRIAKLEARVMDLEKPIEVEVPGVTSQLQARRMARGWSTPLPQHPVDALKEGLGELASKLDPVREAELRALCDAMVRRPQGEATYPDGRPLDSGVNGPDGDRFRSPPQVPRAPYARLDTEGVLPVICPVESVETVEGRCRLTLIVPEDVARRLGGF